MYIFYQYFKSVRLVIYKLERKNYKNVNLYCRILSFYIFYQYVRCIYI